MTIASAGRKSGEQKRWEQDQEKLHAARPSGGWAKPVQVRLQQRQHQAVQLHALRWLVRVGALLSGDALVGSLSYALALPGVVKLASVVTASTLDPSALLIPPLSYYLVTLIGCLVVTASYDRRSAAQAGGNLLKGSTLMAVLVFWSSLPRWPAALAALAMYMVLLWLGLTLGRTVIHWLLERLSAGHRLTTRAVLIGPRAEETIPGEEEVSAPDRSYEVAGHLRGSRRYLAGEEFLHELADMIDGRGIDAVIVACQLPREALERVVDLCSTAGCECLYSARVTQAGAARNTIVWRGEEPFFELSTPVLKAQQLMLKRAVDIVGGALLLVLTSPAFLYIALRVRLDSPGPVFFVQDRAGLGGRRFRMLKFRTMRDGADGEKPDVAHLNHSGDPRLFKIPNDPRVTKFGALLRRWSLDELPQIFNVLLGDMSLVGPRPFFESDLKDYEAHHFRRLGAKPGLTGLWQVSGRSEIVDFEHVVLLDRQYIEGWSLWLDISILLRTPLVVFKRNGAY